jgi:hypothetical protein
MEEAGKLFSWHNTGIRIDAKKRSRSQSGRKKRRQRMRATREAVASHTNNQSLYQKVEMLSAPCFSLLVALVPTTSQVGRGTRLLSVPQILGCWITTGDTWGMGFLLSPCRIHQAVT